MNRNVRAFFDSAAGWSYAWRTEQSVRQEVFVLAATVPTAVWITPDNWKRIALIGVIVIVLAVEFLNTAIEAISNHVRPEIHPDIKNVKDLGSAAVFTALMLASGCWLLAAWERFMP